MTTVVLGATGGIGAACLQTLAGLDHTVVAVGRDVTRLRQLTAPLRAAGYSVDEFEMDLGAEPDGRALAEYCRMQHGGVDVVINAAAIYESSPATAIEPGVWDRTMDTNLRGPVLVTSALAADMVEGGGGRIVHITSITAAISRGDYSAYEGSKAALVAVTRSMAVELASQGVVVNSVAPGWVRTPMTEQILVDSPPGRIAELIPIGRVAEPHEIASVAVWLATESPTFLTGQTIVVDGGQASRTSHL